MSDPVADPAEGESVVDRLLAEHLARERAERPSVARVREPKVEETRLEETQLDETELDDGQNDDLLRRLQALDFVDSLVGSGVALPERIGDYRIKSLLGRGGMGTVYGAFQESLEREVALKVLAPALYADPTMRRRFRIEARATAALHHQHIVPIYDFGEAAGLLYFAMEKIDGVSLDRHIANARQRGRPLYTPLEAAGRFVGVAEALGHAHRRRILHRDIKPANLLVHGDGALALADFGLSKILGEASVRSSGRGGFLGTLQYASPEQARSDRLTPASDLYALGVTMFEALTGELPFRAETPEAVLDALLNQEPRRVRALRPEVPADLAAVVEKLLAKDPGDRYAEAELLARDLRRVADGEPVHVRRQPLPVRIWRRIKKRPGLSAAIAAATVLGAVAIFALWAQFAERVRTRDAHYDNLVVDAIRTIADDLGPLGGPGDLLGVLTGTEHRDDAGGRDVRSAFARAEAMADDLEEVRALLGAYANDGDAAAEAELRAGRGQAARSALDARIEASVRKLAASAASDQIRLYRLFLARAVACLTAAAADPVQARADLQVASLFRPGAFAPRVLMPIADLALLRDSAAPLAAILDELERRATAGPNGARGLVAELLLAAAGELRPRGVQLARATLSAGQRAQVLQAVVERFKSDAARAGGVRWSGFEGDLAALARQASAALRTDPARVSELAAELRRAVAAAVGPRSPLRSWLLVAEFLQRRDNADLGVVAPEWRARGCLDFLALDPNLELVAAVREACQSVAATADDPVAAAALRAGVRLRLEPTAARAEVEAWRAAAGEDAEAYMAMFEWAIATRSVGDALDAAMRAVELSQDDVARRAQVVARLRTAEADAPPGQEAAWSQLRRNFEAL
jgi:tRNA A-37 threonylcarbamoyl transferase component Bud32